MASEYSHLNTVLPLYLSIHSFTLVYKLVQSESKDEKKYQPLLLGSKLVGENANDLLEDLGGI